jgi:dipeptidyl aminopeptidase/acylaminoacyl peptidase
LIVATDYRKRVLVPAQLALLSMSMAQAAVPPIEAFGRKPAMVTVDINPAGTRLAWIEDDGKAARVVIHEIATDKTLRVVNTEPKTKLWTVKWANDDTILIKESSTHSTNLDRLSTAEWTRWFAVNASGGSDRMLLMREGAREWVSGATLLRAHTAKPQKVFMSTWDWLATRYREETGSRLTGGRKDDGWVYNAYEVDLQSGKGRMIESGTQYTTDWLIDDTGELAARSDYNPKYDRFNIFVKDGAAWRSIYEVTNCESQNLISFTADKKSLLSLGRACGDERNKLWSMPLDGSPMKALLEDPALDVEGVYLDPIGNALLGVSLGGPGQPSRWLDPQTEKRVNGLHKSFGARWVSLAGHSANGQRVIALVEDETHPPIYYLVDYDAKKADIVNEAYPLLTDVRLGAVRDFSYVARDQYPLIAYLTLPPDAAEKNLPLVVMPHGGPEARDEPGFDWLAQFLASRGYAVLQPQFRGSTGFGQAHINAGRRQWGLRMQDDVTDGVRALIATGLADPGRVCIVGWSYGGYAALAGAAFTPDLYACAVSIGGISDLPALIGYATKSHGGRESDVFRDVRLQIGEPTDPQVIAMSPARSAQTVRAPILLIHGVDDTVVPISQSKGMALALHAAGKPYEFVELQGEDHWMMTSSSSRIRTLTELERFLGKHLASTPASKSTQPAN